MRNRRSRRFVHPRIQMALVLQSLRQWSLFLLALVGMLWGLEYFTHGAQLSALECLGKMWGRFGVALVVLIPLLPAIIYDSIRISNRFVGPLVRLRNAMQRASRGEKVAPLECRRNDIAEDFFKAFNEMLPRVRQGEERENEHEHEKLEDEDAVAEPAATT